MDFGLLHYEGVSNNLGDEIQSIAAQAFLPQVDCLVSREQLKSFSSPVQTKLILNGWFMHKPEEWPPSPSIAPLLTSIHVHHANPAVRQSLLIGEGLQYFLRYGKPIGARDRMTLELFRQAGVPAFFSGCLTLTLQRKPGIGREPYICAVNVSEN